MIKVDALIRGFEQMRGEHWAYEWGAARKGCVDCSGAFVYQFKVLGGGSIYHGSNSIARYNVQKLLPLSEARPGMAIFKQRNGGTWDDGIDYYHIGLLDRTSQFVLNAKSTTAGFVSSPLSENWSKCAYLKGVEYMETSPIAYGTITTAKDPLNMRTAPSTTSPIAVKVPRGERVGILDNTISSGFYHCSWDGYVGYCSADYVVLDAEKPQEADYVKIPKALAEELKKYL